ncbi:hypothetical protein ACFYZ8_42540 [Streptomyces sp. NPDC001668]|uniref:hypothetical protein n=1 Tax=unclassified Streptomyces TaxID=2593676 RepID=UPI0036B30012
MGMMMGIGLESLCMAGAAAGTFATLGLSLGAGFTGCSAVAAGAAAGTTYVYGAALLRPGTSDGAKCVYWL